jgi:hypothetical protein
MGAQYFPEDTTPPDIFVEMKIVTEVFEKIALFLGVGGDI